MRGNNNKCLSVCLAAGGTGGHVMPAICLSDALIKGGHKVRIITDKRGYGLIPDHLPQMVISAGSPFAGSLLNRVFASLRLMAGFAQSATSFIVRRPDLLVGFGGYPAAAPMLAGWCLRIPVLMHEQNAVIGRTNRMLSRFAKTLMLSWPATKGQPENIKTIVAGLPVRAAFSSSNAGTRKKTGHKQLHLAVFGGSLGASLFAAVIPEALAGLPDTLKAKLHVTHQVRTEQEQAVRQFYAEQGLQAETSSFFRNAGEIMSSCDLVICRSGAATVAEIACAGKPAVLIPFANALDNHQQANADQLASRGAAVVITEAEANAQHLCTIITELLKDEKKRADMSKKAAGAAQPEACARIIAEITETARLTKEAA